MIQSGARYLYNVYYHRSLLNFCLVRKSDDSTVGSMITKLRTRLLASKIALTTVVIFAILSIIAPEPLKTQCSNLALLNILVYLFLDNFYDWKDARFQRNVMDLLSYVGLSVSEYDRKVRTFVDAVARFPTDAEPTISRTGIRVDIFLKRIVTTYAGAVYRGIVSSRGNYADDNTYMRRIRYLVKLLSHYQPRIITSSDRDCLNDDGIQLLYKNCVKNIDAIDSFGCHIIASATCAGPDILYHVIGNMRRGGVPWRHLLDEPSGIYGWTPLMYACILGDCQSFINLLREGANIAAVDADGNTCYHWLLLSIIRESDRDSFLSIWGFITRHHNELMSGIGTDKIAALLEEIPVRLSR